MKRDDLSALTEALGFIPGNVAKYFHVVNDDLLPSRRLMCLYKKARVRH